jgi:hypothetical protein
VIILFVYAVRSAGLRHHRRFAGGGSSSSCCWQVFFALRAQAWRLHATLPSPGLLAGLRVPGRRAIGSVTPQARASSRQVLLAQGTCRQPRPWRRWPSTT